MSQYAREIKHILATLNEQDHALPDEEELDTIHVYPVEGGGILFTRTPLDPDEAAMPVIESQNDRIMGGLTVKTPPLFVLFLLLLCVFVLGDLADNQLIAFMTPTITVTIVPQTRIVSRRPPCLCHNPSRPPAQAIRMPGKQPEPLPSTMAYLFRSSSHKASC